jgi:hypothetical protein
MMPRVVCGRCKGWSCVTPKALSNKGFFPLCAKCRDEVRTEMETEYICIGLSVTGKPCRQIRMHGKKTCWNHS